MNSHRPQLDDDWYPGSIPDNIEFGREAYIDTSYSFAAFHSHRQPGLTLGRAAGVYIRASFVVGSQGRVTVGDFSCLNGAYVICNDRVTIGDHCLLAWGAVVTDTWDTADGVSRRRDALKAVAADVNRRFPSLDTAPVALQDNVWVGFDAVVMPGTTLGQGCIVGCRAVVTQDVPPHVVVVGNPARVIQRLSPNDSAGARQQALKECVRD